MMGLLTLSLSERRALAKQIHETKDVKVFKRSQAFLWLYEGISVQEISTRLGISRQTMYDWVSSYQHRRHMSLRSRLQDRPKSGRPPRKSPIILRELEILLRESPRQHGYYHAEWTAPLFAKVFKRQHDLTVSTKTIRRCLKQAHDVWKRPGYTLARQSETWMQAKGGSREVSAMLQDW
jgi:transposase